MEFSANGENLIRMFAAMVGEIIAEQVAVKLATSMTVPPAPNSDKGLYTITTAAEYLGNICHRTLRKLVADGDIGHHRIKKRVMFTQKDLNTYINKKAKRPARH
jgi:excisionase family DNA binding protein